MLWTGIDDHEYEGRYKLISTGWPATRDTQGSWRERGGGGGRRLFHYAIMTPPCLLTQYALAALVNAEQFVPWRFFRVHCKQLWYGTNKSKQRMMKVNKNLKRTFHELTKCSS